LKLGEDFHYAIVYSAKDMQSQFQEKKAKFYFSLPLILFLLRFLECFITNTLGLTYTMTAFNHNIITIFRYRVSNIYNICSRVSALQIEQPFGDTLSFLLRT
jgi:cytochrome c biogenesis protein CcdA